MDGYSMCMYVLYLSGMISTRTYDDASMVLFITATDRYRNYV